MPAAERMMWLPGAKHRSVGQCSYRTSIRRMMPRAVR